MHDTDNNGYLYNCDAIKLFRELYSYDGILITTDQFKYIINAIESSSTNKIAKQELITFLFESG